MYKLILFAIFVPALVSAELDFKSCAKGNPPTAIRSETCNSFPCNMKNGQQADFIIEFEAPKDTSVLNVHINGKVSIISIDMEVPPEHRNACNWLIEGSCPLKKGDKAIYQMQMPIQSPMNNITPLVQVTLKGDNDEPLVCGGALINIAKP